MTMLGTFWCYGRGLRTLVWASNFALVGFVSACGSDNASATSSDKQKESSKDAGKSSANEDTKTGSSDSDTADAGQTASDQTAQATDTDTADGSRSSDADAATPEPEPTAAEPQPTADSQVTNNTSNRDRLPESLRIACMNWCDAQYATDCAPVGSSIEICDLQCVAAVSTQRDFCIEEYTARTQCLADGGYECVNDSPVPRSTCASETLAYSDCVQDLPCKMYCAAMIETGCADDEDACREQCIADSADADLSCEIRQNSYVNCVGQLGLTCEDGQVIPNKSCISQLFDAADCRNDHDVCATWCEGEQAMGCAQDDCLSTCQTELEDPSCGSDYEQMLDCGIRYGYVSCTSEGLVTDSDSAICDSEVQRYQDCTMAAAP